MSNATMAQQSLLATAEADARPDQSGLMERLRSMGALYVADFMSPERCRRLLAAIDADESKWQTSLKRRVQHYGWRYDYSAKTIAEDMRTEPLPDFIMPVAVELQKRGWFAQTPDQVIINEYQPGQGIAPHIDRNCFGPAVATLSLGDCWPMQLSLPPGKSHAEERLEVFLEVGSVLVFSGDARSRWRHGIAPRKADKTPEGGKRSRQRRVSVTFRTVNPL